MEAVSARYAGGRARARTRLGMKVEVLPAELFPDEVVVVLERLCADSGVDFGHHSALVLDSGVQHCGVEKYTTKGCLTLKPERF